MKRGIVVEIPGFGKLELRTMVSDYTGTLSRGGRMTQEVKRRLVRLAERVDIHILTADTFGTAKRELRNVPAILLHLLEPSDQDVQKMEYVKRCDPRHVAAAGNGNNDRLLLKIVKDAGGLAIAVDNGEGCAIDTIRNANLFIDGAENALDLLLEPKRLKATLRF
jgi:soluble P-type ATPase